MESRLPLPRGRTHTNINHKPQQTAPTKTIPLKPNTDANVPTLPKMTLRRRSLSLTELKVDSNPLVKKNGGPVTSKDVKNTVLKKANAFAPKTGPMKPTIEHNLPPAARAALRRRSKSCLNLRAAYFPNKLESKPIMERNAIKKTIVKSTTKTAVKRPAAETTNDVKLPKQPKLAPWDYKGRLQQLQDKHAILQNSLKEFKEKNRDFDKLQSDFSSLQSQVEQLSADLKKTVSERDTLNKENTDLRTTKEEYLKLKPEHEELLEKYTKITAEFSEAAEKLKTLSDEYNAILEEKDNLKAKLLQRETDCRTLHNTLQDLKGNIRVFCRIRPPINDAERDLLQCSFNYIDERTFEIRKSRETVSRTGGKPCDMKQDFTFDQVFQPYASQDEVFEELSLLVQSALNGYDICVFAYGQTGSGKTYTMQGGPQPKDMGMIPRTIDLLFETIDSLKATSWMYTVEASFLEIYNETIRDLLNINGKHKLEVRFNEGKGSTVTNLTIERINNARTLKRLMESAQENRAVATTNYNEHSSRSHAITKIYLKGYNTESHMTLTGSISLVDLAGSESGKTSTDERMAETKSINKSLSALGSVMMALHNKEAHVPYRNSKLTFLLQSSLGGSSKTLMFVNVAPFEENYQETMNSLRFASKVKEVKTELKRNKTFVQS